MLTKEEYAALLRSFAVDRLLKLVTIEAKRLHDDHVTVFAFTTGYQVAFGTPALDHGNGRSQLAALPSAPTLKEALVTALVEGKDFDGEEVQARSLTREDWTLIAHVTGECIRALDAGEA